MRIAASCLYAASLLLLAQLLLTNSAHGLGMEAFGPAGEHMGVSSDWPKGVQPLLKHPSRVYWQDVNGYGISYYETDIKQLNELLKLFSELQVKRHIVIFRMGAGEAKSFGGKAIPYTVKFDMPAGMFLHHAKQYAATGLYSIEPTLVVHVTEKLAEQLNDLKIPKTIQVHKSQYSLTSLIDAAKNSDRSTRCRALEFLGQAGEDSSQVRDLLAASAKEEDQYIQRNAKNAIAYLDGQKKLAPTLRANFAKYFDNHPQQYRAPTAEAIYKKLKATDKKYMTDGWVARGTLVNHEGNLMNWVVTMGNDRLVIRQTAAEDKAIGRIEHTIFVSPNDMVTIQRSQYWVDGKLITSKPFRSVEPVGNTYDILIGRIIWPLGRGLSRRIDRVESVKELSDGRLDVVAFGEDNLGLRWELTVDPASDYLVQAAKGYKTRNGPEAEAEYIVKAAGVFGKEDRFANHTAHWQDGAKAEPISIAVHELSAKPDLNLIIDLEEKITSGSSDQE